MTDSESPLSNSVLGDLQWLCMVTLFIASSITLILYLIQYFYDDLRIQKPEQNNAVSGEAEALLGWALSLKSWKSQWRGAWCRALNDESRKSGSPVQLTFEEEGLQSSELVVGQVSTLKKSAGQKAAQCKVVGDKLQFSLSASPSAMSPGEPCRYSVKISPLELQLDLQMREAEGEVWVGWGVSHLETWDLQLSPSFTQDNATGPSAAAVKDVLRQLLCAARPSVMLSCRPAQATEVKQAYKQVTSPPKPPRAHDWKLLVKNIRVTCKEQEDGAAGSMNPLCVLQLDDPPQKLSTSVQQNTASPAWDQPFIFELNGRSKELNIQLLDDGNPQENSLMGQVSVPFDLVKKQPKGQQTFALISNDQVTGSLTAEFTYLEPSEVRSWQPPTPAPTKRVEMDRTVMPCGTVVTTITAVKSKPARPLLSGLSKNPTQQTPLKPPSGTKSKLSSRRVSEQPSMLGTMGSKALSSSDTELLMLNGSDPVAEAAIRQLHESAKQKLKSPVKKSTIIISGVAKTPLSQDDEMALMVGYAAAMDASMSEQGSQEISVATASVVGASSNPPAAWSESQEGPSGVAQAQAQQAPEDWEIQADEDPDRDADKTSMSLCISESGSKKSRGGGFLQKSAKLFFRRRRQCKDPGMSQSHNDLVYLEQPVTVDREKRTATFSRMLNRKLLPKSKSKANGSIEMSFHYGQGYPGGPAGGANFPRQHPPPGAPYGGSAPPGGPSPYGSPYGGSAPPGQYGGSGPSGYAPPGSQNAGGAAPGGPYGGYGAPGQGRQAGGAPGAPYGGGQGGPYGQQSPAGNIPPGVNPEAYQWFQTVDTDHSGSITLKELKQALVNSNWSAFNDETCLMMINMFDKSKCGRIDLFGFSALWVFMQQWRQLFQQYDRDRSGCISGTELHQALSQMGYNLSPQFTETIAAKYAARSGRPGSLQLDCFIQVCTQLQSMTQAFREKDSAMTGNIRMSYEDFLSTTVNRLM